MKKTPQWGVVKGLCQELSDFLSSEPNMVVLLFLIPAKPDEKFREKLRECGHNINLDGPKQRHLPPCFIFSKEHFPLLLAQGIPQDGRGIQITGRDEH